MWALKDNSPQQLRDVMFDIRRYKENIAQTRRWLSIVVAIASAAAGAGAKRKAEREEECRRLSLGCQKDHSQISIEFSDKGQMRDDEALESGRNGRKDRSAFVTDSRSCCCKDEGEREQGTWLACPDKNPRSTRSLFIFIFFTAGHP